MSYLDNLYTPKVINKQEEITLDESVKDNLNKVKNWIKYNKYAIGGRALQALGGYNAAKGALGLGGGYYIQKNANNRLQKIYGKAGMVAGVPYAGIGAGMLYAGKKLMDKHNKETSGPKGLLNKAKLILK